MGDGGRESASGGNRGGMESGEGTVGGEHGHICPQHGKFRTNVRGKMMVRHRGIRAPKRHARHPSYGARATSIS